MTTTPNPVQRTLSDLSDRAPPRISKRQAVRARKSASEAEPRDRTLEGSPASSSTFILIEGELRVDSQWLGDQLGNKHEDTFALIERYIDTIKQLGRIQTQSVTTLPSQIENGDIHSVLLNENQTFFLLSTYQNTDRVAGLKSSLIKAFHEARYGQAFQALETRKHEASQCGRQLARWRHDKRKMYLLVSTLRDQMKLPFEGPANLL